MLKLSQQQLIELVKVGIWGTPLDTTLFRSSHVDWDEILSLCDQQTVVGIVTDAISLMPQPLCPPNPSEQLAEAFISQATPLFGV